jgi:hypothetical protein
MSYKPQNHDFEDRDEQDEPSFQRLRKQSGKPLSVKEARKQDAKDFGRAINKFHKERRRYEGPGKP